MMDKDDKNSDESFAKLAAAGKVPFAPAAKKASSRTKVHAVLEPDHPACESDATSWHTPTMSMRLQKQLKKDDYEHSFDLHGLNVANAWEKVNSELGNCVAKRITKVMIIHGAGTGKLRIKVRGWLERSRMVMGYVEHPRNPHSVLLLLKKG